MEKVTAEVRKFMEERDWLTQPVSDVAKSISIEAAELLEKFQWINHTAEEVKKDPELKKEVLIELADVFVYATEMAILLDSEVADIVHEKLVFAAKKYPPEMFKFKGALGSKAYLEMKKKYREGKR